MDRHNDPVEVPHFEPVVVIQLSRIYDALMFIASRMDEEGAEELMEMHRRGFIYGPPPSFVGEFGAADPADS